MKRILFAVGLGLATVASAQNWTPQSFIADNVYALVVSNAIAGSVGAKGITNLQSTTAQGGIGPGTNVAGTAYWIRLSEIGSNALASTVVSVLPPWMTNAAYTNITVGTQDASTNALSTKNLLDPCVSLWTDRNGNALPMNFSAVGSNCFASIMVRTVGGTLASNGATIVIEGVPWGDKDGNYIGTTAAADRFIFTTPTNAAASTTVPTVMVTNVPIQKFIGFKGLRVGSITLPNADNNAGNQLYITHLQLVGFVP